ncbi:MAG: FAD-dependent oxidoreductase [Peptostreptococcaceae bacterium]
MFTKQITDNMQNIVDTCLSAEKAGCVTACPMHTNVKEYMKLVKEDDGEGAIRVIRENLFIPGTLGRICAHPCEVDCKHAEVDNPLAIASIKRYAADNFDDESKWDLTVKESNNKKVAVIGSGPAGLQAAIELKREGFEVVIFEKLPVRGGMMVVGIPEYRLPRTVLEKEISYLDKLGVEFKIGVEIGKDISLEELIDSYDSVIVAVGKHQGRIDKSLKNHDAKGIFSAQEFLKEASLTRKVKEIGKNVLVVGGGDVAMDCCRVSRRLDTTVYSICLEDSFDSMASTNHEIKGAIDEGILFNHSSAIKEIVVDENNRVSKVILKKCLSIFNENGQFAPIFDENETKELQVDTIIFAIGQGVENNFGLNNLPNTNFECNKETLQSTSNEKVFVCGDCSGQSVIVIEAMASGRKVAESVKRYINGENLIEGRKEEDTSSYKTKLENKVDWSNYNTRTDMKELDKLTRINSFDEVELGYTKEEAIKESLRCKQCECRHCMTECIMLNDFTYSPKELFGEYLEKGYKGMDHNIAFSCNDCGQCTIKCPKDLNLRENFIAMKEQYIEDNNNEQIIELLKPYDEIQEKECSDEYSTTILAKDNKKTKYLFVPGCTVPAYSPDMVEKTLLHLREKLDGEVGSMLKCCGKVTKLNGEDKKYKERNKMAIDEINSTNADVIITICPSCYVVYEDTSDKKVISYWDLMKDEIGIPDNQKDVGKGSDVVFNIHDSCATRHVSSHHENVRWILDELGYNYEEMNNNKGNTRCCGVGGMVCSSNPELYKKLYMRRKDDCTQDNVLSYCGSCRGTMEASGKDSLHILNLLFGEKYTKDQAIIRGYKDSDEMWSNRLLTREKLNNLK